MTRAVVGKIGDKFSDLTIIHGENKWDVHRVNVCSASTVLDEMVSTSMEIGGKWILVIQDGTDEATLARVIHFMYNSELPEEDSKIINTPAPKGLLEEIKSRMAKQPKPQPNHGPGATPPIDLEEEMSGIVDGFRSLVVSSPRPFDTITLNEMWTDFRLHGAGVRLGVKDLVEFCLADFTQACRLATDDQGFTDFIHLTLTMARNARSTIVTDDLYRALASACATDIGHLLAREEFRHFLVQRDPFAYLIINEIVVKQGKFAACLQAQPVAIKNMPDVRDIRGTEFVNLNKAITVLKGDLVMEHRSNLTLCNILRRRNITLGVARQELVQEKEALVQSEDVIAHLQEEKHQLSLRNESLQQESTRLHGELDETKKECLRSGETIFELRNTVISLAAIEPDTEGIHQLELNDLHSNLSHEKAETAKLTSETAKLHSEISRLKSEIEMLQAELADQGNTVRPSKPFDQDMASLLPLVEPEEAKLTTSCHASGLGPFLVEPTAETVIRSPFASFAPIGRGPLTFFEKQHMLLAATVATSGVDKTKTAADALAVTGPPAFIEEQGTLAPADHGPATAITSKADKTMADNTMADNTKTDKTKADEAETANALASPGPSGRVVHATRAVEALPTAGPHADLTGNKTKADKTKADEANTSNALTSPGPSGKAVQTTRAVDALPVAGPHAKLAGNKTQPTGSRGPRQPPTVAAAPPLTAQIAKNDKAISVLRKQVQFLEAQSETRLNQASKAQTDLAQVRAEALRMKAELQRVNVPGQASRAMAPRDGTPGDARDPRTRIINAIREAGLECRVCTECNQDLNFQFRGVTENLKLQWLALKCTGCEAEVHRWTV